jgi:hypothetical protein
MDLYGGYLTWQRLGGATTLAASSVKTQRACVFGDASALATSSAKYKDYNAESLTQTLAVSPVRPCIVNVMDNFNTERFIIIEVLKRPLLWDTSAAEYLFTICRNIFSNHHINYKIVHFQSDRQ